MSKLILELAGKNGQIELFDDRVVIKRKGLFGFLSQGLKGTKEIPLPQITAIQLKECSKITDGYMQLSILGGIENTGGLLSAGSDENSVLFGSFDPRDIIGSRIANINAQWLKLKEEILQRSCSARGTAPSTTHMDELKKVGELYSLGIITETEFQEKKKQLLGL